MTRTLEELDRELQALREEVNVLKEQEARRTAALLQYAGCFTGDEEWEQILREIEAMRRQPAEELAPT